MECKQIGKCGGHIHFGADFLEDNPKYWDTFLKIWEETEELFDVNLLYYSKEYDAAIITADKDAPNNKAIESFLNCFLEQLILGSFGI